MIHIEPGVYDLGAHTLVMKPYVDIEGSGQGVTTITTTGALSGSTQYVAVEYAQNAELREVTVVNTSSASASVYGVAGATPSIGPGTFRMTDVTVEVPNGVLGPIGFHGAGTLRRCSLEASGLVPVGIYNSSAVANAVEVYDSRISASGSVPVAVSFVHASAEFVNTELVGSVSATNGATVTCVSCYTAGDGGFTPLNASCQ